jgi:uncharacterized protein YecT (DUF1311 family)
MAFENRKLIYILGGLLLLITAAFGWSLTRGYDEKKEEVREEAAATKKKEPGQDACASNATYARLKEVAFEEAQKLRNSDPANLDTLAARSVVRMEDPVVRSRDDELNVTVCSGRFILELPPGAERAFGGERRLSAEIEYAAQAAADGSGLVYQVRGAEPIITRLAAFDMRGQQMQAPATPQAETEYAEVEPAPPAPRPAPREAAPPPSEPEPAVAPKRVPGPAIRVDTPAPEPRVAPKATEPKRAEPTQTARGSFSNPSFSCRSARTRGEKAVCASQDLAARDRAMSSMFYSAMASADAATRAELRRTRDRFLGYRDRCGSDACIAEAYDGRMREIRDIVAEAEAR